RDYLHHFQDDAAYRDKAARVSALTRDLSEVVLESNLQKRTGKVVFQSPCSLQHGQQIRGKAEALLRSAGYDLAPVADGHLCCGSAGTYSILQPELSMQLRDRKLQAQGTGAPA